MIDSLIEKITQGPLFLKLKGVIENNGYHDHEDVYSHSIKTKNIALREIKGDFITSPEAKKSFLQFINEDFHGFKRADIMILIALLHDIGKILSVKEDSNIHPLLVTNTQSITSCPGHEYWGSTIVAEVLNGLSLPKEITDYIAAVIRNHDAFSADYFEAKSDWDLNFLLNHVKSRAEGLYKEAMFNQYCDCFTAAPFQAAKETAIKVFNEPSLYIEREYAII